MKELIQLLKSVSDLFTKCLKHPSTIGIVLVLFSSASIKILNLKGSTLQVAYAAVLLGCTVLVALAIVFVAPPINRIIQKLLYLIFFADSKERLLLFYFLASRSRFTYIPHNRATNELNKRGILSWSFMSAAGGDATLDLPCWLLVGALYFVATRGIEPFIDEAADKISKERSFGRTDVLDKEHRLLNLWNDFQTRHNYKRGVLR
jgi:hypothetical protein